MVDNLAFVVFTVLAPADWAGEQFVTIDPVDCVSYMDRVMPEIEASGWEVMAQCFYTQAPATSPRPVARPTKE